MEISFRFNKRQSAALVFVIVLAALYFRRLDAFTNPQLYAEDGNVFLQQYYDLGIRSLFTAYAGYIHLVPRLIAFIFGILNVNLLYIPLCYNISSILITLFVAHQLLIAAYHLNIKYKTLYAVSFIILPIGAEIYANVTNIIWITSVYLVNFIFIGYKYGNKYINSLVVAIFAMTGPFSLILLPIALYKIWRQYKTIIAARLIPLVVIVICGLLQFVTIAIHHDTFKRGNQNSVHDSLHLIKLFTNNIEELLFIKNNSQLSFSENLSFYISLFVFAVILLFVTRAYSNIKKEGKEIILLSALFYLASYVISFWPNEASITAFECPRYFFVTYTCLFWLFIIRLDGIKWAPLYICAYLFFFLLHYKQERLKLPDKQWKQQVTDYYHGRRLEIEINPDGWKIIPPK